MTTYFTRHPVGSAAVKDLYDNAENLDFAVNDITKLLWTDRLGRQRKSWYGMEVAFTTQLTGQENRFNVQLAGQENRFNTFIGNSGYDVIGDYYDGPLTVTEYNQLIRYGDELWKLTAATDLPYTTAGNTDETWTSTDAAHFVSVGDAALRQNLGSSEGLKYIGRCQDVATLRAIEPSQEQQLISVVCHTVINIDHPYQINSGGNFQYDSTDTTTPDDDWLCIVTTGGKRWKRVIGDGLLNIAWSGVYSGDITRPLKQAVARLKSDFISSGGAAANMVIAINGGKYSLTETIDKPSHVKIVCLGDVTINASAITTGTVFSIFNDATIPKPSFSGPGDQCNDFMGIGGTLTVIGSGKTTTGANAFMYGNKEQGCAPVRGVGFSNIVARNFTSGLGLRFIDTYLLSFSDSRLEQNYTNMHLSNATNTNSGESITFTNMIFGGSGYDHVFLNLPGIEAVFDKCKFDYAIGSAIRVGEQCNYSSIKMLNCRGEEMRGTIVAGAPGALGNVNMLINNFTWLPRPNGNTAEANSPSRPLFAHSAGVNIQIVGVEIFSELPPYTDSLLMSAELGGTLSVSNYIARGFRYIPSSSYILNRGYRLQNETTGTTITSASTDLARFDVSALVNATGVVVDLDGGKAVKMTGTASDARVAFVSDYIATQPGNIIGGSGAMQALDATGNLQFSFRVVFYDKDLAEIETSTTFSYNFSSVYANTNLPNFSEGRNRKLASAPTTRTAPPGTVYARCRWEFSSFVGDINIINMTAFKVL